VRKKSYVIAACVALVLGILTMPNASAQPRFTVLVFSKVNGFVHDSIPAGLQLLKDLGNLPDSEFTKIGASPGGWDVDAAGSDPAALAKIAAERMLARIAANSGKVAIGLTGG